MSIPYLAQREDQQQLEWIGGSVFSVLLDAEATGGQLTVGRFDVSKGEAPPFHVHTTRMRSSCSCPVLRWCGPTARSTSCGRVASSSCPGASRTATASPPRRQTYCLSRPPEGFGISAQLLAEAAELSGRVVLGPPR
jgi:hypothetical protein